MLEYLKSVEVIVGLLLTVFGAGWSLMVWNQRRADRRDKSLMSQIKTSSDGDRTRLGRVEGEVKRLDTRLGDLNARMESGFKETDERFAEMDRRLDKLASKEDVTDLKIFNAKSESRMETLVKNDNELKSMIHRQGEAFSKLAATIMEKVAK